MLGVGAAFWSSNSRSFTHFWTNYVGLV